MAGVVIMDHGYLTTRRRRSKIEPWRRVSASSGPGARSQPSHTRRRSIPVTLAERPHPFPSRTRKLSSPAPKILRGQPFGKIGRRRDLLRFRGSTNGGSGGRRPRGPGLSLADERRTDGPRHRSLTRRPWRRPQGATRRQDAMVRRSSPSATSARSCWRPTVAGAARSPRATIAVRPSTRRLSWLPRSSAGCA